MSVRDTPRRELSKVLNELRSSTAHTALLDSFESILEEERNVYESQEASEFLRGRISIVKQILNNLRG